MKATHKKYLIIGAGPGGLQMGYFLKKAGLDYLILERNEVPGSFFSKFPIHRQLISINKKYNYFEEQEFNWRHDWNSLLSDDPTLRFTRYSDDLFPDANVLVEYLRDYATRNDLDIQYGAEVTNVAKEGGQFTVSLRDGATLTCEVLLIGTGPVSGVVPDEIEGIEHTTPYSEQSLDLEFYKNKRVGILGGGNSAFESANYLAGSAAFVHVLTKHPLKMAWDTHFVGDLRAINNNLLDMYQLKSLHAVISPTIRKIERLSDGQLRTHHSYDYPRSSKPGTLELTRDYDVIINCTGFNWVPGFFDESTRPDVKAKGKYPLLTSTWESQNVANMYFIGGAMQAIDRKSASGFIHGFRYNVRALSNLLKQRYEGMDLPSIDREHFDLNDFLDAMYERLSLTAGLFQLYGFLGDLILFSKDLRSYKEIRELPVQHIQDIIPGDQHALQLTLEFGFEKYGESALSFLGPSDPNNTPCAAFLHPVIRHFFNGKILEFHFGDSLLARWDRPHGEGGAVVSYHYLFQQWLKDALGLEIELPEPVEGGPYRLWSEAEIEAWHEMEKGKMRMVAKCDRSDAE